MSKPCYYSEIVHLASSCGNGSLCFKQSKQSSQIKGVINKHLNRRAHTSGTNASTEPWLSCCAVNTSLPRSQRRHQNYNRLHNEVWKLQSSGSTEPRSLYLYFTMQGWADCSCSWAQWFPGVMEKDKITGITNKEQTQADRGYALFSPWLRPRDLLLCFHRTALRAET